MPSVPKNEIAKECRPRSVCIIFTTISRKNEGVRSGDSAGRNGQGPAVLAVGADGSFWT